ncbi:MAG TPA: transposase [Bacteroidales bacterium]|nr:transposase [Bacteroidales bacterium]
MEGFVKYSRIYRGNIADCKTLEEVVNHLSVSTSATGRKPTVVIDAGIETDENLAMLKAQQYKYVCVSRSKLKDYQQVGENTVVLYDRRKNPIEVRWVKKQGRGDRYLYVRSELKALKESSMDEHFSHRYEEELNNIAQSIHKKGGTKKYEKVIERIGRIKERYPTANKHYDIEVKEKDAIATMVAWKRKPLKTASQNGVYFLRTNLEATYEKLMWDIYNTIREIEATFRVLKTDLSLRPVYHQKDEFTHAHLNLAILAYMVVNTIRYRLKKHKIHHDWQNIVRIMNTQKVATITMNDSKNSLISRRICSRPTTGAMEIYLAMGYKPMPFYQNKFVFTES